MEILYGWLIKGRCEVSILDGFIFFSEALFLLMSCVIIYILIANRKRR